MYLIDKIKQIYPDLTDKDFNPLWGTILLQNNSDGLGTYIKSWNNMHSLPSNEQLIGSE